MTYNEMVMRAYGATVSHGDHESATMLGWKRIGFRLVLSLAMVLALCVVSCKQDSQTITAPPPAITAFASTVMPGVLPMDLTAGTVFRHYKVDAGVTFVGQDAGGMVILDIRVDGSQQFRTIMDPGVFTEQIWKSPDWSHTVIAGSYQSSDH